MQKKVLSVIIESQTPWVGDVELRVADNGSSLWAVAVETSVGTSLGTEGGFYVTVKEDTLAHNESAGRIGAKSGDGMVSVVVVETRKHHLPLVVAVVPIGVA